MSKCGKCYEDPCACDLRGQVARLKAENERLTAELSAARADQIVADAAIVDGCRQSFGEETADEALAGARSLILAQPGSPYALPRPAAPAPYTREDVEELCDCVLSQHSNDVHPETATLARRILEGVKP